MSSSNLLLELRMEGTGERESPSKGEPFTDIKDITQDVEDKDDVFAFCSEYQPR